MSLILTTAIEKGGTGKTTTVVNLAALMAAEGKRVLVVDMDQQANTTYMLTQHKKASGKDLTYFDQEKNEHYIPYVIEPSLGCDRVMLAFLCEAYDEEVIDEAKNDVRVVLHLHPALAPYKAAILPLSKKLSEPARKIYQELSKYWMIDFDETGSIGKRYRREDEIGTPYCITVDFETIGDDKTPADNAVTIRDRDTMQQVRVPISELKSWLEEKLAF